MVRPRPAMSAIGSLHRRLPSSVIIRYYLYGLFSQPGFIQPIYVLYLLANDISFAAIGAIGAMQAVITVGGEIPTGYVGDRIGRRNSLVVAQVLLTVSAVLLLVGHTFIVFAAAFGLLSVGMTFVSGSVDAWLYDTLAETGDEDRFTHVRGRGSAVRRWGSAAAMIGAGFLYVVDPRVPFFVHVLTRLVALGLVLTLPTNAQYAAERASEEDSTDEHGPDDQETFTVREVIPLVRERLTRRPLRPFVVYMALFIAVAMTAGVYFQPIAKDSLSAATWLPDGLEEAALLGILYAAVNVVSAVASDHASQIEAAFGLRAVVLAVPALVAVMLVLPAVVPILAIPMFFAIRGGQSLVYPIAGQYLNDHIESVGRATVLSAVSMVYGIARVPFAVGSGVAADLLSPLLAVALMGATLGIVGGALALFRPPVASDSATPAGPSPTPD